MALSSVLVAAPLFASDPRAGEAVGAGCERVLPRERVEELFASLVALGERGACAFSGLDTEGSLALAHWRGPSGEALELVFSPPGCLSSPTASGSSLALRAPEGFAERCPGVWRGLSRDLLRRDDLSALPTHRRGGASGAVRATSALIVGRWLFALTLLALALLAVARWRRRRDDPGGASEPLTARWSWPAIALGVFGVGLALHWWVAPSMANWYSPLLPPSGAYNDRFGPGAFVVQEALRATVGWSLPLWLKVNALIGALLAPLTVGLAHELRLRPLGALTAALLLAVMPYDLRLSASPGAHVLAATLLIAGLWLWLRALRRRSASGLIVAGLLLIDAAFVRANVVGLAMSVPLLGWLVARGGLRERFTRRATGGGIALALLSAALVWALIVEPSHHPRPTLGESLYALSHLASQFWEVAARPPHWLSPWAVGLAALGLALAPLRGRGRSALLLLLLVAAAFGSVGRDLERDELLSARYFKATLPLLALAAGLGFDALHGLLRRLSPRDGWPARLIGGALILAIFALRGLPTEAYTYRYTFEDEYDFLALNLARLPAGCAVYGVPARTPSHELDLDCCLWPPRSPLPLAYPALRFFDLPLKTEAYAETLADPEAPCVAWYRGALCSLQDTPDALARFPSAVAVTRESCAAAQALQTRPPIARGQVSPRHPNGLFADTPPTVELYLTRGVARPLTTP